MFTNNMRSITGTLLTSIGLFSFLLGCSEPPQPSSETSGEPKPQSVSVLARDNETLRLYVFNCGEIRVGSVENFGIGNDETSVRNLIVPCYVIEHPQGTMLWDGGVPSASAQISGWSPEVQGMSLRLEQTLAEQLASMRFDLNTFDYVAFSHIHWDHVGVANEVKNATWLVQEADYNAAFPQPGEALGPAVQAELFAQLKDSKTQKLNGDHDVFGDGRVRIISAPGHTPGHQVLYLDLAEYGPLILSGDLYHFRISRAQRRVPEFNVNKEQTLAAMDKVEALVTETGAQFWIEHDLALFETLKTAPNFYQ